MTRDRPFTFLASVFVIPVGALAVAAFGDGGSSASKNATTRKMGAATAPPLRSTSSGTVDLVGDRIASPVNASGLGSSGGY